MANPNPRWLRAPPLAVAWRGEGLHARPLCVAHLMTGFFDL